MVTLGWLVRPNFSSIGRPSLPLFQTETKMNFVFGFSFAIFNQPPVFSSAWQLEHHGAHKCTTVRSGALIASRTCRSAADSARIELATISAAKMEKPSIRMLMNHTGEMPTAQRPTLNLTYSSYRGSRVGSGTSAIAGGRCRLHLDFRLPRCNLDF